jgi:hypothetical protein
MHIHWHATILVCVALSLMLCGCAAETTTSTTTPQPTISVSTIAPAFTEPGTTNYTTTETQGTSVRNFTTTVTTSAEQLVTTPDGQTRSAIVLQIQKVQDGTRFTQKRFISIGNERISLLAEEQLQQPENSQTITLRSGTQYSPGVAVAVGALTSGQYFRDDVDYIPCTWNAAAIPPGYTTGQPFRISFKTTFKDSSGRARDTSAPIYTFTTEMLNRVEEMRFQNGKLIWFCITTTVSGGTPIVAVSELAPAGV